MLTTTEYKYYQPTYNGDLPAGLYSFQAFPTKEDCERWLEFHVLNPSEWTITEYKNDDIEEVTLLDADGQNLPRIEDFSDDELADMFTDEVMFDAGSIDNLLQVQQPGENLDQYMDRVYTEAFDKVNDVIAQMEEDNIYNYQAYAGTPETEWYDEPREMAVEQVMRWMLGKEDE